MSNDLNQCQFTGRLGKDPEVRYLQSGDAVANFSVAVGSQWKDKNGAKQEATEWVSCSAFGKLAEICSEYLKKGSQVFVQGRVKTDKYTDKEGVERYSTKIVLDRMQMFGGNAGQPKEDDKPQSRPAGRFDDIEDNIPF